jgi:hypothetical protein
MTLQHLRVNKPLSFDKSVLSSAEEGNDAGLFTTHLGQLIAIEYQKLHDVFTPASYSDFAMALFAATPNPRLYTSAFSRCTIAAVIINSGM